MRCSRKRYRSDSAESVAAEIKALGRESLALKADVSSAPEVAAMFGTCMAAFQKIDILVNNAGITRDTLLMRMKEADWDLVLGVNLKSAFLCCREAARPMLRASSGKIINIASVVGINGNPGQANYSASKAGLIGLTKTLSKEFGSRGVTVNAVAPGFIQTAMTDKLSDSDRQNIRKMYTLAVWDAARCRQCGPVPCFISGGLHHRPGHRRRWRTCHVARQ